MFIDFTKRWSLTGIIGLACLGIGTYPFIRKPETHTSYQIPVVQVQVRSFNIAVHTVGELEAAQSTSISSSIRGDQGKLIWLIADGAYVKPGDLLIKIDPTPFEEKIEELKLKIKDQEASLGTQIKTVEWEINQSEMELKTAAFETETAELELNKIINGDGPQEIARLNSSMQKALVKYEELQSYSDELKDLEKKGFLNAMEVRAAQKKLQEEKDAFDDAKMQYDCYVTHVYPMLVKKAETHLKRCNLREEEQRKSGIYKIAKAQATMLSAEQSIADLKQQQRFAEWELQLTELKAPAQGMVVQREEYRGAQRRKPRIGDILVKNQPLLDLPDLTTMLVKTKLREVDLCKVCIGKEASIEVDAYPHLLFNGKLTYIGVLALTDLSKTGDEKFFEIKVGLNNPDNRLRPGMTARITIHADSVKNKLTIPCHAIFENGKQSYCYVQTNNGFVARTIEIGGMNEQWAEVSEGLNEEEFVSLTMPPQHLIVDY